MKIMAIALNGKEYETTIAEAISGSVEDELSEGQMEAIQGKLNNIALTFGRLVEALYTNHNLTDEQIKTMLGWRYTIED